MVKLTCLKISKDESEKKIVSKILLSGSINDISYNLTISGDPNAINILRTGLKLSSFKSCVDMELRTSQTDLNNFKKEIDTSTNTNITSYQADDVE